MKVEKDWMTESGLRAVVVVQDFGNRCGYVAVPKGATTYGEHYDDVQVDVHGGLTFSDWGDTYPVEAEDVWWFGYDCAHYGDARDPTLMSPKYKEMYDKGLFTSALDDYGVVRSLEYCVEQCESLASQLKELK